MDVHGGTCAWLMMAMHGRSGSSLPHPLPPYAICLTILSPLSHSKSPRPTSHAHLALALPAGREFAQLPPGNAPLQRAAPHVRVLGDGERSVFALSAEGGAQAHGLQLEAEAPPLDQLHTEEEGVFWR